MNQRIIFNFDALVQKQVYFRADQIFQRNKYNNS